MQTSSPPVITPNRSQSNPDDMITLPRPIQSVGMDLHDVSGTSTGQTLPRERKPPSGTHFCPTIWWVYPHSATIFILHPLLPTFSSTCVRNIPTFDHSSILKRRAQTSVTAADLVWVCAPPRTIRKWLRRLAFGSCGPGRKILAAAAVDLVWVCAPPRTIRKWLRRLAFWILRTRAQDPCSCCCRPGVGLRPAADHPQMVTTPGVWILRTRAQDPCSCCCRPGVGLRPAADHPQMVTTPGVLDPADPGARSLQLLLQTWCGSAPRRGPSANGYDAWRFGSCGPARKILAAAA